MKFHRGLWAGIALLGILSGCSEDKTLNVEGSYSPVIADLSSDREPAVRGEVNALTAVMTNVRGYPLKFHWSAATGTLTDSTAQTAHWVPPDVIGVYPVTVAVEAHDDLHDVSFYTSRTFQVYVENEYARWTRSTSIQFDVVPPTLGKVYFSQIRSSTAVESDVWAVATPLGSPELVTQSFYTATSPSIQSDGSRIAFLGRRRSSDAGPSVYLLPGGGGDTTAAVAAVKYNANSNAILGSPRFAPTGSLLLYHSDSTSSGVPRPWIRDAGNLASAPFRLVPGQELGNSYWNGNWSGVGDSIVLESYRFFNTTGQIRRGLFKLKGAFNANPTPYTAWLTDSSAAEPDWSADGQFIVFTRKASGRNDRDLYIIRAGSSDKTTAVQVTRGPADDSRPRFSSDGSTIFFISDRADRYGLNGVTTTERRGTNVWSVSDFDLP